MQLRTEIVVCQRKQPQEGLYLLRAHTGGQNALRGKDVTEDLLLAGLRLLRHPDALAAVIVVVRLTDDKILRLQPLNKAGDRRMRQIKALFDVLRIYLLFGMLIEIAQHKGLLRRQSQRRQFAVERLLDVLGQHAHTRA